MERASQQYEGQLRKVGRIVGRIALLQKNPQDLAQLLRAYADALVPWAQRTAWQMLLGIDAASYRTWRSLSSEIATHLRREAESAPIKPRLMELLADQVEGIKSIPQRAAERVEKLALETVVQGKRFNELQEQIAESGKVSESDATRLARTSVSGAATALMQARSEWAGSTAYVWETSRDSTVRASHRAMQGKVVKWDEPPTIDGYTAHAGQFANCRCWPRPIFPLE